MTQGTTAWAAVVFPRRLRSRRSLASKFSCHRADEGGINGGSLKALLPGRGDLLSLARVGSRFSICGLLALDARETNEHVRQAKAADKTTSDFPQITAERK